MKYGRQQAEETIDFRHPRQDCTAEGLPSLKGRAEWGRYMIFADHSGLDTRQREVHASPSKHLRGSCPFDRKLVFMPSTPNSSPFAQMLLLQGSIADRDQQRNFC